MGKMYDDDDDSTNGTHVRVHFVCVHVAAIMSMSRMSQQR